MYLHQGMCFPPMPAVIGPAMPAGGEVFLLPVSGRTTSAGGLFSCIEAVPRYMAGAPSVPWYFSGNRTSRLKKKKHKRGR